jgi:hypothetical protein
MVIRDCTLIGDGAQGISTNWQQRTVAVVRPSPRASGRPCGLIFFESRALDRQPRVEPQAFSDLAPAKLAGMLANGRGVNVQDAG